MKKCLAVVAAVLLALPSPARAQVRRTDLNLALGQLDIAVRSLPPVASLPRIRAAVTWLTDRAATSDPALITQEYVRSLTQLAELLRTVRRSEVIDDVAEELEAKVEHCRRLGIGMGGSVRLNVNTRRGGQTVAEWQVFYMLKVYEHVKGAAPVVFPTLSTPTEAVLEPGRYWLWARDPATGRTSERALVRVIGETQLRLDLPVP
ncbi:MAG TPA: hypothetical protein VM818_07015 [Vicinamibacterales bacterium]|jgi:hypothetical protein|nr:hypothetical protein [Vicinamibacterales bacterium]